MHAGRPPSARRGPNARRSAPCATWDRGKRPASVSVCPSDPAPLPPERPPERSSAGSRGGEAALRRRAYRFVRRPIHSVFPFDGIRLAWHIVATRMSTFMAMAWRREFQQFLHRFHSSVLFAVSFHSMASIASFGYFGHCGSFTAGSRVSIIISTFHSIAGSRHGSFAAAFMSVSVGFSCCFLSPSALTLTVSFFRSAYRAYRPAVQLTSLRLGTPRRDGAVQALVESLPRVGSTCRVHGP